jgi:peptidyl-prolyl cis-trans isomerase B (cyclophilin B)
MRTRLLTLPAAVLLAVTLAGCGEDGATTAREQPAGSAAEASPTGPTTECTYPAAGSPAREVEPPPEQAAATGEVTATMATSIGDLRMTLPVESAPCAVNSFVSLAEQGYFDDTSCHRLTTRGIYVLQCGDPTGSGSGSPGYSFPDEVTEDTAYPAGTLAMANAGADTNGSQFFLVYERTELPPLYTVFGQVDEASVEAVRKAAKAGTDDANGPGDGAPNTEVTVDAVTID